MNRLSLSSDQLKTLMGECEDCGGSGQTNQEKQSKDGLFGHRALYPCPTCDGTGRPSVEIVVEMGQPSKRFEFKSVIKATFHDELDYVLAAMFINNHGTPQYIKLPIQQGQRYWVAEEWLVEAARTPLPESWIVKVRYKGNVNKCFEVMYDFHREAIDRANLSWQPPSTMPEEFSGLTVEVVGVEVKRDWVVGSCLEDTGTEFVTTAVVRAV